MSLSTAIVYSIFYLVGNNAVPYVAGDDSSAVRYKDEASCKAALVDIRSTLAAQVATLETGKVNPQQRTDIDKASMRAQSMSCEAIEIDVAPPAPAPKVTVVPASADTIVMWKIGRVDKSNNVFHGTAYNEYAYDDEASCKAAYEPTQNKVFDKALADGSNNAQASSSLTEWIGKYSCQQVSLEDKDIVRQPIPAKEPGVLEVAAPKQVIGEPHAPQEQLYARQPQYVQQSASVPTPQESALMPVMAQLLVQGNFTQQQLANQQLVQSQALAYQQLELQRTQQPVAVQQPQYVQPIAQYQPQTVQQGGYAIRPVYASETTRDVYGNTSQVVSPTQYRSVADCLNDLNIQHRTNAQCVYAR